jgi:protein-tyrosine phosphatase
MIDIHTHLLPDFDDGPATLDDTRNMLTLAERDGTRQIVLTSHILVPKDYEREDEILAKFEQIKTLIRKEKRKLKVYLGGEIFLHPETELNRVFSTINDNRKYALVEFGMREIPDFVPQKLFDWIMQGYKPILAHPERYLPIIKNPRYAYKFAQMGVALQVNSGSLMGIFGESVRKCALRLIDHRLVQFVASDGHDISSRSISLVEPHKLLSTKYSAELADRLLEQNPLRAIRGQELIKEEPIPFDESGNGSGRWHAIKRRLGITK